MTECSEDVIREWFERLLEERLVPKFKFQFISVLEKDKQFFNERSGAERAIGSVPVPRGCEDFRFPEHVDFICGYCIGIADLHLRLSNRTKAYYEIRVRGVDDNGLFQISKHIERTSGQSGISF